MPGNINCAVRGERKEGVRVDPGSSIILLVLGGIGSLIRFDSGKDKEKGSARELQGQEGRGVSWKGRGEAAQGTTGAGRPGRE